MYMDERRYSGQLNNWTIGQLNHWTSRLTFSGVRQFCLAFYAPKVRWARSTLRVFMPRVDSPMVQWSDCPNLCSSVFICG